MFNFFKKKLKVMTHNGNFHPDEILACATISLWAVKNNLKILIERSRDFSKINKTDIVVDVGGIYDPDNNRFDHHQNNTPDQRENGIPYASFGLVWKKYRKEICGDREVADRLENKIVLPIDARDNGLNLSSSNEFGILNYQLADAISIFNPTAEEKDINIDDQFIKALSLAEKIIERQIAWSRSEAYGFKETEKMILEQNNPEILIIEKNIYWQEVVSMNKAIKFVIYPEINNDGWRVKSARDDFDDFRSDRANMPESWWGLRDKELILKSGVKDAVFCIKRGWFAVAKSRGGAIEMAKKALQNNQN